MKECANLFFKTFHRAFSLFQMFSPILRHFWHLSGAKKMTFDDELRSILRVKLHKSKSKQAFFVPVIVCNSPPTLSTNLISLPRYSQYEFRSALFVGHIWEIRRKLDRTASSYLIGDFTIFSEIPYWKVDWERIERKLGLLISKNSAKQVRYAQNLS